MPTLSVRPANDARQFRAFQNGNSAARPRARRAGPPGAQSRASPASRLAPTTSPARAEPAGAPWRRQSEDARHPSRQANDSGRAAVPQSIIAESVASAERAVFSFGPHLKRARSRSPRPSDPSPLGDRDHHYSSIRTKPSPGGGTLVRFAVGGMSNDTTPAFITRYREPHHRPQVQAGGD